LPPNLAAFVPMGLHVFIFRATLMLSDLTQAEGRLAENTPLQ